MNLGQKYFLMQDSIITVFFINWNLICSFIQYQCRLTEVNKLHLIEGCHLTKVSQQIHSRHLLSLCASSQPSASAIALTTSLSAFLVLHIILGRDEGLLNAYKANFSSFLSKKQRVIKYPQVLKREDIYSHFNKNIFNFDHALNYHIFAQFTSYVCIKSDDAWSYLLASALA